MFNPSQLDVRNFFFDVYAKAQLKHELTDLEKIAYTIILTHSEYHSILADRNKYADYQWTVEMGQTNPFLHLSMHMSIVEQLSIDQPFGIKALYHELCTKSGDAHATEHEVMDCLGEMLWQAQNTRQAPDAQIYLSCLNRKLGKF